MKKITLLITIALCAVFGTYAQYVNPLSRWATHNVDNLNTFVTGEVSTARGKLYQFGRNIPLSSVYGEEVPTSDGIIASSPADSKVWTENLLITVSNDGGAGNWFPGGLGTDKWTDIVNLTVQGGAPASYLGTNGGDPCPEGWHLPTANEYNAILSKSKSIQFNPDDMQYAMINDVTEYDIDLDGSGTISNYTADYRVMSVVEAYGLRFKGTPQATAFHYIYDDNSFIISAKPAGSATVDEIALTWTTENWNDAMILHFPRIGYRGWTSRHLLDGGELNRGYYWSSTASDDKSAWRAGYYLSAVSGIRIATNGGMARRNAFCLRCVKNYNPSSGITDNMASNLSVWSKNGELHVSSPDLIGKTLRVYNMVGANIYNENVSLDKTSINLPKGFYVITVGRESVKAIVK